MINTQSSRRLLNHIVDDIARDTPQKPYAELPRSSTSYDDGFRTVSYRDFSNAINAMARWLHNQLGPGKDFETLTYLGPNDFRHAILLLGAVKAGYKMLFTSPRYSTIAHIDLLKRFNSSTMLVPAVRPSVSDVILQTYEMRVYQIPELEDLLGQDQPHFPYEKSFEESRNEPLVALHTSGTTGLPKPITWTHDWAASFAAERYLAPPLGYDSMDGLLLGVRLLSLMPPFHASGLFGSILFPILSGTVVVYPPSGLPPVVQLAGDCLKNTSIDCISLVPSQLEELGRDQELLEFLAPRVKTVMWAGGDVSLVAGNAVSSKLNLFTCSGSTEMGLWPILKRSGPWIPDQWKFLRFHPAMNMTFQHHSNDMFEGHVQRNSKPDYEQSIFKIFPTLERYATGDLLSPHPVDPQLWQYRGRVDDMQIFLTGEKFHPTDVEELIAQHPDIFAALFIGTQRTQGALLLELHPGTSIETSEQQRAVIENLWPTVQEANKRCPAYAKVTQQHILLIDRETKPMVRSGKGSVQRAATVELFDEELTKLFERATLNRASEPVTAHALLTGDAGV